MNKNEAITLAKQQFRTWKNDRTTFVNTLRNNVALQNAVGPAITQLEFQVEDIIREKDENIVRWHQAEDKGCSTEISHAYDTRDRELASLGQAVDRQLYTVYQAQGKRLQKVFHAFNIPYTTPKHPNIQQEAQKLMRSNAFRVYFAD